MNSRSQRIIVSECCLPKASRSEIFAVFRDLRFSRVEAFTTWAASRIEPSESANALRREAESFGLQYASLHLPDVREASYDEDLEWARQSVQTAAALGMTMVYIKGAPRDTLVRAARELTAEAVELGLVPLIEPHDHTPADSIASTLDLLDAVGDHRLQTVLEIGHLVRAKDDPMDLWRRERERVAVVHLKNADASGKWTPWREGVVDVAGLMDQVLADGFEGDFVLELQLGDEETTRRDLADLAQAVQSRVG